MTRDQLAEALRRTGIAEFMVQEETLPIHVRRVRDAASTLLAFPTDEDVEVAAEKLADLGFFTYTHEGDMQLAREALEAVRDSWLSDKETT